MSNTHPKTETPTDADLKGNPGISQSKGMTGSDVEHIEADSLVEGDTANETKIDGGIDANHRGRINA